MDAIHWIHVRDKHKHVESDKIEESNPSIIIRELELLGEEC